MDEEYKLPLDSLTLLPWNPRTISDEAFEALKASIVTGSKNHVDWNIEDGYRMDFSITVNKNGNRIIGGHQRVKALRELGQDWIHKDDITWVEMEPDSLEEKERNITLNNQYVTGEFTGDALSIVDSIKIEMPEIDFDRSGLGNLQEHLSELFGGDKEGPDEKDDVVPPVPEKVITKTGDLWILGNHRLLCGDATKKEDVERLMDGEKAGLFVTDPPYGVNYSKVKDGIPGSGFRYHIENWGNITGDSLEGNQLQKFLESAFSNVLPFLDHAAWYLWHAHLTQGFFAAAAAAAADVLLHRQIIWKKPGFVLTRSGMYHWSHEPCFYGWVRGQQPKWLGDKSQKTVWEIGRDADRWGHPVQKPVELFAIPIKNHLNAGEICVDLFVGSGTTIIACEKLNRRCFAMEIEPKYCDVAVHRWEDYTGRKAERK